MKNYSVEIDDHIALFYQKIAETAEKPIETVLKDSLFVFAGNLAGNGLKSDGCGLRAAASRCQSEL